MTGRGIGHPFWFNARKKADTSEGSDMSVEDSQQEDEVKAGTSAPSVSTKNGNETKRQRMHSGGEPSSSSSSVQPPAEPLFQSASDVGRKWHFTRRNGIRHRSKSVPFTIISYNVLADSLLHSHPTLYDDCEEWILQWEYRKKNLLKEILFYDADILCLQEVQETHYTDWFQPQLSKEGYQGIYKKRTGNKGDGCAIFYRETKFTLLEHRFLDYKMDHVPIMDRDNIALLALLHPKYKDGRTCYKTALCVVNTHLLFNRNRGDIKLLQLATLFAEIDMLKKEFLFDKKSSERIRKIPVVLCGDFNMTPEGDLYKYISTGYLNYNNLNKKDLSGQNFAFRQGQYSSGRDGLRGNIIPIEMGLTNSSTWDNENVTNEQTVNATSSTSYDTEWPTLGASSSSLSSRSSSSSLSNNGRSNSLVLPQPNETVSQVNAQAGTSSNSSGTTYQKLESTPQELPKPMQFDSQCTVIRHRLFFWSVYRHVFRNNVREVTTYHGQEPSCTVDYIFASPGREEGCHTCRQRHSVMELTGSLSLLSEEEVAYLGGLPSPVLSSDHLSLVASFALHL